MWEDTALAWVSSLFRNSLEVSSVWYIEGMVLTILTQAWGNSFAAQGHLSIYNICHRTYKIISLRSSLKTGVIAYQAEPPPAISHMDVGSNPNCSTTNPAPDQGIWESSRA